MRSTIEGKARIAQLEHLVDELIKDKPEEKRVRSFMEAAGLRYCDDPIERMDRVLSALRVETGVEPQAKRREV